VRRSLLVCLLGVACGGGLGRDAGPFDAGADAVAGNCPLQGTWQLTRLACGAQDLTAEYLSAVPSTTLTLEAAPAGCAGTLARRADFCTETETFTAEVRASTWSIMSNGITECLFPGCTFGFDDTPCDVGDGAGQHSENLSFGTSTFTTGRVGMGTACAVNVAQVITWSKQ
jgi:hypothetical protein